MGVDHVAQKSALRGTVRIMSPFRRKDPEPELRDPPYPGLTEKMIAAAKPLPSVTGPAISLDGQPSVRLQTRGQP
jgi:hypothetical protein